MIGEEKLEYFAFGKAEYLLNLLSKHSVKTTSVMVLEDGIKFKISSKDQFKLEQIFKNYGKKFQLLKRKGWIVNVKNIIKNVGFWLGVSASIMVVIAYSFCLTEVKIIGAKRTDEEMVRTAVFNELKLPNFARESNLKRVEKAVAELPGISYVSLWKDGRTLNIEIVEELPNVEKIDTQNFVSIKAKENGIVTKIVVYGGTGIVKVGDEVNSGQDLILPYLENANGERKNTLAIGKVYAKIVKENEVVYETEKQYEELFAKEYEKSVEKFKSTLSDEDEYLGSHFFVKNVDKTIVCSIYYEYISRIT